MCFLLIAVHRSAQLCAFPCISLMPEWERLAHSIKNEGAPVSVAKVDCTENSSTAHRFGIRGYPTLKMIADGKRCSPPPPTSFVCSICALCVASP